MKIVIIDYGAGNTKSVQFALKRIGYTATLSSNPTEIESADKIIFPGVGHASKAMKNLTASGLDTLIPKLTQPVLGICLGMQLLCNYTEEGNTKGLGIFDVTVKNFSNQRKVPQMGWNTISNLSSKLFKDIPEASYVYLVHSYYAPLCKQTIATTVYGENYATALQNNNFYGTQFHPEKSSSIGEKILQNFIAL